MAKQFEDTGEGPFSEKGENVRDRRRFWARCGELGSGFILGGVLLNNFRRSRIYYKLNFSESELEEGSDVIQHFYLMQEDFQDSLIKLSSAYRSAYHESRQVPYTSTDGKGNTTINYRTEYYWDEERGVPRHGEIEIWESEQRGLAKKIKVLTSEELIDISRLHKIAVEEKKASRLGQGVLNVAVYGGGIGLLLGYEEILASIKYKGSGKKGLNEKVREVYTDRQTNRRSFLKIGAALAGTSVAWKIGSYHDRNLEDGKNILEREIDESVDLADISPTEAFARYFGISHAKLIDRVQNITNVSRGILNKGVKDGNVRQGFGNVVINGERYVQNLEKMFVEEVPEEMGFMINCRNATEKLKSVSSRQSIRANTNILLEGLVVGGTMAALLIPAEVLNHKYK